MTNSLASARSTGSEIYNPGQPVELVRLGYIGSLPWDRAEANIDFQNTWTKTVGNHTIKWGGDFRPIRDDLLQRHTFGRNTPQYRNPGTSITSSTFGKVTGYCSGNCGPRDVQLGLKVLF